MKKLTFLFLLLFPLYFFANNNSSELGENEITVKRTFTISKDTVYVNLVINRTTNYATMARVVENLPSNIQAVPIDTKGGDFTHSEGQIKIIYISLPTDSVFTIRYALVYKNVEQLNGVKLKGQLNYSYKNARQIAKIASDIDDLKIYLKSKKLIK